MTAVTDIREPGFAEELGAAAADFLRGEGFPDRLRDDAPDICGLHRQVADLGLLGVLVPEEGGGIGGGAAELVAVFRAVGRGLLPLPLAESVAAASVLADDGYADGTTMLALAGVMTGDPWAGSTLDGDRITGRAGLVNGAGVADRLLVPAWDTSGARVLALVAAGQARFTPVAATDRTYRPAEAEFTGAPATTVARGAEAERAWRQVLTVGRIAAAAELTGIANRLVELAVAYVGERKQFGRPVGSFQAVKHLAADAATTAYAMDSLCRRLAGGELTGLDAEHWADSAKAFCSRAALQVAETALQMFGGIGFTAEHDLALYFPRILTLGDRWGDPAALEAALGARALADARGRS
ncbi:acyl-CoA dehydrogenase family protein [Micromonospora sp. NPDC005087]|uniref:acyl-CoA dehydrogenase family protein n=1 Tax=Micromonospora sp. NPDC005087 TaxID=3364225 RepID=UPI003676CFD5